MALAVDLRHIQSFLFWKERMLVSGIPLNLFKSNNLLYLVLFLCILGFIVNMVLMQIICLALILGPDNIVSLTTKF